MGAANLSRKQLAMTAQIEAWAERSTLLHKAEGCDNNSCGGRRKIWWIVRHPQTSPEISNEHARKFVIHKLAVCEPMLARLADGQLPWLPGEAAEYAGRSREETFRLLGILPPEQEVIPEVSPEEVSNPFPEAAESLPRLTKTELNREKYRQWKAQQIENERQRRQQAKTPGGYGNVVDALRRKG